GGELLDELDLLRAVVLGERTLPHDVEALARRRLAHAGLDALPEHLGRALGDHRDAPAARRHRGARRAVRVAQRAEHALEAFALAGRERFECLLGAQPAPAV